VGQPRATGEPGAPVPISGTAPRTAPAVVPGAVPLQVHPARRPCEGLACCPAAEAAALVEAMAPAGGVRHVAVPAGLPVLWSWSADGGHVEASERVRRALRLPPGARVDLGVVRRLVHPDDRVRFDDLVLALAGAADSAQGTVRFVVPGGVRVLHAWAATRVRDGAVVGAFGGLLDVTGAGPQLDVLLSGLGGLHAAEELTGVGLWEWDPVAGELLWTAPMYGLLGVEPGALRPTVERWHDAVHPQDRPLARRLDVEAPGREGSRLETLRVTGADGVLRYVRCWSRAVPGPDGVRVSGAAVEVSRQVRDQVRLERLSATDAVTGLLNRQGLVERLRHVLAGGCGEVALILLDLDHFKVVNDTLGHHIGDALLVEVARRLGDLLPPGTVTARMGGDEFAVLAGPGIDRAALYALVTSIVAALRGPYRLPGSVGSLSCPASAGVTSRGDRTVGPEELLAEADLALYQAKDNGRGRFVVFDDPLRARARARHLAERTLRSALAEQRLVLHHQPVVDLTTGRPVGAEALVRIRADGSVAAGAGGAGRLLPPEEFIDVAEDTGLIVELDCWVMERALEHLAACVARAGGPDGVPWLAVNVSPRSMDQPGVISRLLDGLQSYGLPPRLLKVELTERSFLGQGPVGESALRALLRSGVPVGIDDFGTGYSALAYLQRFDLDFMKIDRSFVAAVGAPERGRADAVVTAIVDLAHAHGMEVTAEGIEHPWQAARLREIGCDLAQGYHFGRPTSQDAVPPAGGR